MENPITFKFIPGLIIYYDVINHVNEKLIIDWLDNNEINTWSTQLSRRTQQFGYSYDYTAKNLNSINKIQPISGPLMLLSNILIDANILTPEQCICNEYTRNQGIAPHTDNRSFGDTIAAFSLNDDTSMTFENNETKEIINIFLPARSLLVMSGEARYNWKHSISKNISYKNNLDKKIIKSNDYRRISATFRSLKKHV